MAATDPEEPSVRWSVQPANEAGPDGRTSVEHTLDPGESVEEYFAVRNISDQEVTFRLAAADGFYTPAGRFDMLSADKVSVDSGTWITLPKEVTIAAGQTAVVPFEIIVPERAEPGDHAAGITASVLSTQSAEDGTSVGLESRVGFKVLTRVAGDLAPTAELQAVSSSYALSWNPFRPGQVSVTFDVVNTGNTRLIAEGIADVGGQQVAFPAEGEIRQELLPGDEREITVLVDAVWPTFVVPTRILVNPTMITMGGDSSSVAPIEAQVITVAIPWPQLIVILGVALIVLALVWGRLRSRRRIESLLAQAREEGRREVTVESAQ